jgi:hypothetical protein
MNAIATQYLTITSAHYESGYSVKLRFNDGFERVVDFEPFLKRSRNPDIQEYRDINAFKTFQIENGNLMWGDYQMIFPIMDLYRGEI